LYLFSSSKCDLLEDDKAII